MYGRNQRAWQLLRLRKLCGQTSRFQLVKRREKMKRIMVAGVGTMGNGIVQELAEAGLKAVAADEAFGTSPQFLQISKERMLLGIFNRKNAEGKFVYRTREAVLEVFNRIEWCSTDSNFFKASL